MTIVNTTGFVKRNSARIPITLQIWAIYYPTGIIDFMVPTKWPGLMAGVEGYGIPIRLRQNKSRASQTPSHRPDQKKKHRIQ